MAVHKTKMHVAVLLASQEVNVRLLIKDYWTHVRSPRD